MKVSTRVSIRIRVTNKSKKAGEERRGPVLVSLNGKRIIRRQDGGTKREPSFR